MVLELICGACRDKELGWKKAAGASHLHAGCLFAERHVDAESEEDEESNEHRGIDGLIVHAVGVLLQAQCRLQAWDWAAS